MPCSSAASWRTTTWPPAGLMRAFFQRGRHIAREVSVVGFEDAPRSECLLVPLTTVRQDFARTSARAVAELVSLIGGGGTPPKITILPVELTVRESSGPPPPTRKHDSTHEDPTGTSPTRK